MNDKPSLAEKILLAIAPTIVQTEQFRAYEEIRAQYERNLKAKKDGPELILAKKEFEAWRSAFVDSMLKETSIECARLAYAIAEEFNARGGSLESALRKRSENEWAKQMAAQGAQGLSSGQPITVDMRDRRI